jgi:CMP-N,N'-diacetyllegionaminic acid synthase
VTEPKTFCFDIDGVICTNTHGDYERAEPISSRIAQINALHGAGHKIVLFTARGTVTGLDCREITERQMKQWGVRYHDLYFGKPYFDLMIDDRAMSLDEWERHAPTVLPK